MSWKFAGIIFEKNYQDLYPDLLRQLGVDYTRSAEGYTFSDALDYENQGTALGIVNGRTMLLNRFLPYDCSYEPGKEGSLDPKLASLSSQGEILNYILDGVSGTYCFSLFSGGERVRRWGTEPGHVLVDEGQPVAGEDTIAADSGIIDRVNDEAHLMVVWEAFLGESFQKLIQDDSPVFHYFE